MKRKSKRQEEAKLRDAGSKQSPEPVEYVKMKYEGESSEQREQEMRELEHQRWLQREQQAQLAWRSKKEWEEREKIRINEQEQKIREEWEERQKREKKAEERKQKADEDRKEKQDKLLKDATANENKDDGTWHNPLAPALHARERVVEKCPFFLKTGVCRFAERCSRAHDHPEYSATLLFPGMYAHFSLEQALRDEYDTDIDLEYEDDETVHHFEEFYDDVLPEFKKIGRVIQFKVCRNYEPHLRGNVYVQFESEPDAVSAFQAFNGRWYGGRQLNCEFTSVSNWKAAICGLYDRNRCPKGKGCNFLHVFRNPTQEFLQANCGFTAQADGRRSQHSQFYNHRRYSGSHSRSRSPDCGYSRSHDRQYNYDSHYHHRSCSVRSVWHQSRSGDTHGSRSSRHRSFSKERQKSHSKEDQRARSPSRDRRRSRSRPRSASTSRSDHRSKIKDGCKSVLGHKSFYKVRKDDNDFTRKHFAQIIKR